MMPPQATEPDRAHVELVAAVVVRTLKLRHVSTCAEADWIAIAYPALGAEKELTTAPNPATATSDA